MKKRMILFLLLCGIQVYSITQQELKDFFKQDTVLEKQLEKNLKEIDPEVNNYFSMPMPKWRTAWPYKFRTGQISEIRKFAQTLFRNRGFLTLPRQRDIRHVLGTFFYRAVCKGLFARNEYATADYNSDEKIRTNINKLLLENFQRNSDLWKLLVVLRENGVKNDFFDNFLPIVDMSNIAQQGKGGHVLYKDIPLKYVVMESISECVCGNFCVNRAQVEKTATSYFPFAFTEFQIINVSQMWANSEEIKKYDAHSLRFAEAPYDLYGYVELEHNNLIVKDSFPVFKYLDFTAGLALDEDMLIASLMDYHHGGGDNPWIKRFDVTMSKNNFIVSCVNEFTGIVHQDDDANQLLFDFSPAVFPRLKLNFGVPMFLVKIPNAQILDFNAVGDAIVASGQTDVVQREWTAVFN